MDKVVAGLVFQEVGVVDPERDSSGRPVEYLPQARYAKADSTRLNPHGAGPFCRFSIGKGLRSAGVYLLTVNDVTLYVGKCENLEKRWGGMGYGGISPKNCYVGGQSTNCKINSRILQLALEGHSVTLWFHPTADTSSVERLLIHSIRPPWNTQLPW